METADRKTRVVAAMRLSGHRFDPAGMPADSLVEITAFENIVRSLMKLYWKDRNKQRKRTRRGYDAEITLRLVNIEPGSSIPLLEYNPVLQDEHLLSAYEQEFIEEDFRRAVSTIDSFIKASSSSDPILPSDINRLPISQIKKFGQTLKADETIQVSPSNQENWGDVPGYTSANRAAALVALTGGYTKEVVVDGHVTQFDVAQQELVVRDRNSKSLVTVPYENSQFTIQIASGSQIFECNAAGIGEFSRTGKLERLESITDLEIFDVTEDAEAVRMTLRALESLEEGWIDGEGGQPISLDVIARGEQVIEAMIDLGSITRIVHPTEEGGVRFSWPDDPGSLTIEVEPEGTLYVHTADFSTSTFSEETIPPTVSKLSDRLEDWMQGANVDE